MVIKIMVAGMVAAVQDDRDRHRYSQIHRLVRADGLGEWTSALDDIFSGPTSQFLLPEARDVRKQFTQKVGVGNWQYEALAALRESLAALGADVGGMPGKGSCGQWFQDFVTLRNKTRGHGAARPSSLALVCQLLEKSIDTITDNLSPFQLPWAYIRRNLSGKYRVSVMGGDGSVFDSIKRRTDVAIEDGVYVALGPLCRVELLESDPDLIDFYLPNGAFNDKRHEILSYITGDCKFRDSRPYLLPATQLPPSETQGLGNLDVQGNCFGNLPTVQKGYISRQNLERTLREQLRLETHPIVTLNGPGGIGKTSLALEVLWQLAHEPEPRFAEIVWFSARDIDLLPDGPKVVRPHGVTLDDFAAEHANLLEPTDRCSKGFKPTEFLARQLEKSDYGPTLFVFDNFETVRSPGEIFAWLDTYIRQPNKILITTRIRGEFRADYPVEVGGMSDEESMALIKSTSDNLGIWHLLNDEYCQEPIRESGELLSNVVDEG